MTQPRLTAITEHAGMNGGSFIGNARPCRPQPIAFESWSRWSRSELRDAVHRQVDRLRGQPDLRPGPWWVRAVRARLCMLAFIGATAIAFPANAQTNIPALPTPDIDPVIGATVNVLTRMSDNRILVGGDFLRLGSTPANGCGRLLPDGSVDSSFQCTRADAFAQDSSGRIYSLRKIIGNGVLVRLLSNGSPDPSFTATNPDGTISAMVIVGDAIYLGGTFGTINTLPRSRLAKLSLDGVVDPDWLPSADGTVSRLLAPGDGFIYAGGGFANINTAARNGLARLAISDAALDVWNPALSGGGAGAFPVTDMASDGTHLYVSGAFTQVQGQNRTKLAKIGLDGAATLDPQWTPLVLSAPTSSGPRMLSIIGDSVYLGESSGGITVSSNGQFKTGRLLRLSRTGIATLDTSFDPLADITGTPSNGPSTIIAGDGGGRLFVGGQLSQLSQAAVRLGLAALNANGSVDALSALVEAVNTANVANISFDPVDGSSYAQGNFIKVNGVLRQSLIHLFASGAVDGGFRPAPMRYSAVVFAHNAVYAADDDARLLRKLDRLTGDPVPGFTPIAYSNLITQLSVVGGRVYLIGSFTLSGITPSITRVARLDAAGDSIDSNFRFNPNSGASITGLTLDTASNSLFLLGNYTTLNGTAVVRLARIDAASLTIDLSFAPLFSSAPSAILSDDLGGLWVHGGFSTVNGETCRGPARLLIASQGGLDPAFSCNRFAVGGSAMAFARDSVYIKGNSAISRFVRSDGGAADPDWVIANLPLTLNLIVFGDRLYVHGNFSVIGAATRNSLAAFPVEEYFLRNGFE